VRTIKPKRSYLTRNIEMEVPKVPERFAGTKLVIPLLFDGDRLGEIRLPGKTGIKRIILCYQE
jgi:hypothetical protein